ncbi:hypothetical protein BD560DRAFT_151411 [Blakeslea trispora]|nr:hypothetical protein BD560DRAFT_151411 [Blakeslea trispora]
MFELTQLLNKHIWYCPTMARMRSDTADVISQDIILSTKRIIKKDTSDSTVSSRNNTSKQDCIDAYMEYVFDTFKRPKIAITYYDMDVIKNIEAVLQSRKMKYVHINNMQSIDEKVVEYDKSDAIQVVLLDLGIEDMPICFKRVDLSKLYHFVHSMIY